MKVNFLNLGKQPIANNFLKKSQFKDEFFYDLSVVFDDDTKLVSLNEFVKPELMFNSNYVYNTSLSKPMVRHFKDTSDTIKIFRNNLSLPTKSVLEIGSNDGTFIKHFDPSYSICIEPCSNFSVKTAHMGYQSYTSFWDTKLSNKIKNIHGTMDLIYAANCICHIQDLDDCFEAVHNLLSDDGMFIFEDPSLLSMLHRNSYDQIYDEHAHIFSVTALSNVLHKHGLTIIKVDSLSVHGGSNRIYAMKSNTLNVKVHSSVNDNLMLENLNGLNTIDTYINFANRINRSKEKLIQLLQNLSTSNKRVISIGATSKSTTVFNYCGIDTSLIELITDTTPDKQGLYSPGAHIPVVSRDEIDLFDVDFCFLGAWNFKDVIIKNESDFIQNGGKFITHVPHVTTLP